MPRGDKKVQIMQAAETLFATHGTGQVTTDDIAKAAHVGKGTIYNYFKDKDDLFFQTANLGIEQLCQLIQENVSADAPFAEQLLAAAGKVVEFFDNRRRMFGIMQQEDNRTFFLRGRLLPRWLNTRKKLIKTMAEIIERGVQQGQVRTDITPEILAQYLLGMLRARSREMHDVLPEQRLPELLVSLFCFGAVKKSDGPQENATNDAAGEQPEAAVAGARGAQESGLSSE